MKSNKNPGTTLYFSQFGGERPIPEKFIAAMNRAEKRTKVNKDAELPALSDEIIEARFDTRYENTNDKQLVVITKKKGRIGPLRDIRTTDQGRSVQVDAIMFRTTDTTFLRAYPSATQDVGINDLGNGWSIQELAIEGTFDDNGVFTPGIYQGVELTTKKDDPLPSWLTKGVTERETQSIIEGTVAQPTLVGNDLVASERQTAESKKLLSRLTRDNVTLPANQQFVKQIEDLLPARFRGLVPSTRQAYVATGTVAEPTLGPGELLRSEEQISALVKLVEVLSRTGVAFPKIIVETATITEYGGGKVTVTSSIANEGTYTVDEGEGVVSSKITKLGEGHEIKETIARVDGAWPIMVGTEVDDLGVRTDFTEQTVLAGTTGGLVGNVRTQIKPTDGYRSQKRVDTLPTTVLDSFVIPMEGTTNVNVPPQLISLSGLPDVAHGDGSHNENGIWFMANHGSGSLSLRASAQASAAAMMDLNRIIKQIWGEGVPCIFYLFFVPKGTPRATILTKLAGPTFANDTVNPWPKFVPEGLSFICSGQKISIELASSVSAVESTSVDYLGAIKLQGYSRVSGSSLSRDVGVSQKVIQFSPTIHGALSVATNSVSEPASAVGTMNFADQLVTNTVGVNASANINPTTVAATPGISTYPSSGLFLHRLSGEPAKNPAYIRYVAEVIQFSDLL